jgi:hypothetical protein
MFPKVPSSVLVVILSLGAVFGPSAALGAPSVSDISGALTHGNTVTISGSGFGAKITAAPVVWDDASTGTLLTDNGKWSGAWPDCGTAAYHIKYTTPIRGIALPHSHISRYIAGAHGDSWTACGAYGGPNVVFWKYRTIPSYPRYTYMSWYQRADDAWVFGGDNNFKVSAFSEGDGPYNMPNNWYISYNTPLPESVSSGANWTMNDDLGFNSGSLIDPDMNGNSHWWDEAVNPMAGAWSKVELEYKITPNNDGYIKLWENGALRIDYAGPTDKYIGNTRSDGIGGYVRMYGEPTNWRYFADAYLDYSRSRILLGNASTLAASTIREVQIPSAWGDTALTLTTNLGQFTTGTAYLYVIDSVGAVNASGYPVTIGGAPDTTPPAAPSGLGVQ